MKSFKEISIGVLIVFIILFVLELCYCYKKHLNAERQERKKTRFLSKYDLNHDGIITKEEIAKVIEEENKYRKSQPIKMDVLYRSWATGALRGCMTGLLIGGVEGAVTGGVVMGIINPLIVIFDHHI